MKQRKPRDIESYVTPKEAAATMRKWADDIEKKKGGLVKVTLGLWFYATEVQP